MRLMRRSWPYLCALSFVLLAAGSAFARDYLNESRAIADTPQSATERFTFVVENDRPSLRLDLAIDMTQGQTRIRILDPDGRVVTSFAAQQCTVPGRKLEHATMPGTYTAEVTTTNAVGHWCLRIYDDPAKGKASLGPGQVAGSLMMLVAVAGVWFWRRWTGVRWRWFWVGAAVWAVAVAVKFAIAVPLNKPVEGLESSLPNWAYLAVGMIYGGGLTGITEIVFILIAALIWRQMTATASRGVAVGIGAGAFEAALLAIATIAAVGMAKGADTMTWSTVPVPAVERLLTILCHTASRALVLLAVARKRWILFWYGFLLLSGVDAAATLFHLTGWVKTMSPWIMEALLAPFALASIPITIWCVRHWPPDSGDTISVPEAQTQRAQPPKTCRPTK
jgi:uncharacterized membrane protein YhfC